MLWSPQTPRSRERVTDVKPLARCRLTRSTGKSLSPDITKLDGCCSLNKSGDDRHTTTPHQLPYTLHVATISILVALWAISSKKWTAKMKLRAIIGLIALTVLTTAVVGIGVRDAVLPRCIIFHKWMWRSGWKPLSLHNGIKLCKKPATGTKRKVVNKEGQIAPGVRVIARVPANQELPFLETYLIYLGSPHVVEFTLVLFLFRTNWLCKHVEQSATSN